MLLRIILLMTLVPAFELIMLINIHEWLSVHFGNSNALFITIGSILGTGIIGAQLAKSQGFSTIKKFREASAKGQLPTDELMDGFMILIGGALLLTPGFLTDFFGFSLLIPWTRGYYRNYLRGAVARGIASGTVNINIHTATNAQGRSPFASRPTYDANTIEAEYIEPEKSL